MVYKIKQRTSVLPVLGLVDIAIMDLIQNWIPNPTEYDVYVLANAQFL